MDKFQKRYDYRKWEENRKDPEWKEMADTLDQRFPLPDIDGPEFTKEVELYKGGTVTVKLVDVLPATFQVFGMENIPVHTYGEPDEWNTFGEKLKEVAEELAKPYHDAFERRSDEKVRLGLEAEIAATAD